MIHTDEDVKRIVQEQEAKAVRELIELDRLNDITNGKGVVTLDKPMVFMCGNCGYDNHMTDKEREEFERESAEEAAEIEERNKAERTCVGEVCVFVQNLGMLANDFAYTCTYSQSPRYGLVFTRFHRVCSAMFD